MTPEEKNKTIGQVVNLLCIELGCTLLETVTKMQATAVRDKNWILLDDLCEYKNTLIYKD